MFNIFQLSVNLTTLYLQGVLEFLYPDARFRVHNNTGEYDIFSHGGMLFLFATSIFFSLVRHFIIHLILSLLKCVYPMISSVHYTLEIIFISILDRPTYNLNIRHY